jgi:hypothetical protein
MQPITITPQIENGRYFIDVPDDLKNRDLIIQIIVKGHSEKKPPIQDFLTNKLEKVKAFAGMAKNSTYQAEREQWYQQ